MSETEKSIGWHFARKSNGSFRKGRSHVKDHTALLERVEATLADDGSALVVRPPLAEVLHQIGVKPFTPESVAEYKKAMVRKRFQLWNDNSSRGWIRLVVFFCVILNAAAFYWAGHALARTLSLDFSLEYYLGGLPPLCFAIFVVWMVNSKKNVDSFSMSVEVVLSILTLLALGLTLLPLLMFRPSNLEWKTVSLKEHKKDIPLQVMERVGEIRMRCREARFFVDELGKKPDPFLVVSLGEEEYHVAVWLESKFDGKCLV